MLGSADNGVPVLATPEARRRSLVLPLIIAALVAALAVLLAASGRSEALVGSGSTLAQPLIERSAGAFRNAATADNPSRPGETGSDWVLDGSGLEYEPVGSLGGIMRLSDGGAHFAVSDYPLTKEALEERKLAQFPVAVGAVAVVHTLDLPDDATLKLDAETLGKIYTGSVKTWNDPAIAALNTGVTLPDQAITPVHRSDGSGSTFGFTGYLSSGSDEWKNGPGTGSVVTWPTGTGAERSSRMLSTVQGTPGAIGYLDAGQAERAGLKIAALGNSAGSHVDPSPHAMSAAVEGADWSGKDDYVTPLTTGTASDAYPATVAVYGLVPREGFEKDTRRALQFLRYVIDESDAAARELGYLPLPPAAADAVRAYWAQALPDSV
ncbi:phosphate ABC transporter substrate-binding protein PstS [Nostocoides sp.]|uniref:phosphate ABC transporter substrate-binding protein PstS n=1 Tax=Nostocoides sp. TaxID=1917966 RepID=UPI003BAF297E